MLSLRAKLDVYVFTLMKKGAIQFEKRPIKFVHAAIGEQHRDVRLLG